MDEDERVVEAIETNLGKLEGAIFRAGKGARRAQGGPRQHGGQAERSLRKYRGSGDKANWVGNVGDSIRSGGRKVEQVRPGARSVDSLHVAS